MALLFWALMISAAPMPAYMEIIPNQQKKKAKTAHRGITGIHQGYVYEVNLTLSEFLIYIRILQVNIDKPKSTTGEHMVYWFCKVCSSTLITVFSEGRYLITKVSPHNFSHIVDPEQVEALRKVSLLYTDDQVRIFHVSMPFLYKFIRNFPKRLFYVPIRYTRLIFPIYSNIAWFAINWRPVLAGLLNFFV
jgi:hypothetical protein